MGVSIQQWRAKIGCNKSLYRSKNLHYTTESTLTSPTSSTRSRNAAGLSSVLLILALLCSPINPQFQKYPTFTTDSNHQSQTLDQPCPAIQGNSLWSCMSSPPKLNLLMGLQHSGSWQHISSKQRNKKIRAINGNRESRGIRLAHWNAGSAHLPNKMTQLELAVADHHPHILGISEANFKQGHDLDDVQLADYDLFLSKTLDNQDLAVSRIVVYKHQSLVGGLREDLMSDTFSSIWMEIGLPRKKKILVCKLYREWQYLGQPDTVSNGIPAQL